MADFELTHKAVEDLANIWEFTFEHWSEQQADKYYRRLLRSCQEIANDPEIGKSFDGISMYLFGYKTSRHIIFYRIPIGKPIEIIRILHERMDLKRHLGL